jgi:uncharacterized protein YndB with AHSA1/START domain
MTQAHIAAEPVRKRVRVSGDVHHAFRTFTEGIGTWWPVETHSITAGADGSHPPKAVVFEPKVDGRVYEVAQDGKRCDWATVLVYDPPNRLVLEWTVNPTAPPTEVEVRFVEDEDGTVVELEHRGFERHAGGGETERSSYDAGWPRVLARFESVLPTPSVDGTQP